jgi:hypothetical protein
MVNISTPFIYPPPDSVNENCVGSSICCLQNARTHIHKNKAIDQIYTICKLSLLHCSLHISKKRWERFILRSM